MKLSLIREIVIREGAIAVGAVLVAALVFGGSLYYRQSAEEELAKLKRDLALANNRIVKLEEENTEALQLFSRHNRLPASKKDINFNDMATRIALLQPQLESIRGRYRLPQLEINLTNVASLGPAYERPGYGVMFNTFTLTFAAMSDQVALSALFELGQNLPGYVRYENIELKRVLPLDQTAFLRVQAGTVPPMVTGKATLSWRTIRKQ